MGSNPTFGTKSRNHAPQRERPAGKRAFRLHHRDLERKTRVELATSSLARRRSTTELLPHAGRRYAIPWARGDSNSYTFRHWFLRPACLPFHHSPATEWPRSPWHRYYSTVRSDDVNRIGCNRWSPDDAVGTLLSGTPRTLAQGGDGGMRSGVARPSRANRRSFFYRSDVLTPISEIAPRFAS